TGVLDRPCQPKRTPVSTDRRKSLMKRTLLASGMVAAMLFVASSAFAQSGINLRWTNCAAVGGLDNRTFAGLSNLGVNTLAGTFILPSDLPRVSGNAIIVDLISQTSPLPP